MGCTVEEANRRIQEARRKYGKKEVTRLDEAFKALERGRGEVAKGLIDATSTMDDKTAKRVLESAKALCLNEKEAKIFAAGLLEGGRK